MSTGTGRLFPTSSRLDVDGAFRASKTVDRSNPYARFSARSSSRVNETTMFSAESPRSTGRMAPRSVSSDPFDGSRKDVLFNLPGKGLRMTGMEDMQRARGKMREDNPRPLKRAVSPNVPDVDNSGRVFTAQGELVRGRRGPSQYPEQQIDFRSQVGSSDVERQCERARSSDRFRNTPQYSTGHVINPKPNADPSLTSSVRFSRRPHTPTLVGVLHPVPERQPPSYRVRAPFHTDD